MTLFIAAGLSACATSDSFRAQALAAAQDHTSESCEWLQEEDAIACAGGLRWFLHNARREWSAAPEELRPDILQRYLRVPQMPQSWEAAAPLVRPRIRSLGYRAAMMLDPAMPGVSPGHPAITCHAITDHLCIELVVETATAFGAVPPDLLQRWGVTREQAYERAEQNLAALPHPGFRPGQGGVWVSATGDGHDAARMLLDESISRLPVEGEPLMIPADPGLLFVVGSDDVPAVGALLDHLSGVGDATLSLRPVLRRNGSWETLTLPAEHELHMALAKVSYRDAMVQHEAQKPLLDRLNTEGPEWLYSDFLVQWPDDGPPRSFSVWTQAQTCVPVTDDYAVVDPSVRRKVVVPLERVLPHVGTHLTPMDHMYPPRWCSASGLSDAEFAEISEGFEVTDLEE